MLDKTHSELITLFCQKIASSAEHGEAVGQQVVQALRGNTSDNNLPLLEHLYENYGQACTPTEFVTQRLDGVNARFEQAYELLRQTFDPSVISPRASYVNGIRRRQQSGEPDTSLMLCRSFRVSGLHHYAEDGTLATFGFDPLATTESVVSVISGTYIPMADVGRPQDSIFGIGHLATRQAFRRQGHAQAVTEMLEQQAQEMAATFNQSLQLILLEAEPAARAFWAACGYRWPSGSRYLQPPISFNADTGEKESDDVPETLMVKQVGGTDDGKIDKQLLLDGVRALYLRWYSNGGNNPVAAAKIADHVFGNLFADFAASIQQYSDFVPLVLPPMEDHGMGHNQ